MNIRKFKWILVFAGAIVIVLLLRGFALRLVLSLPPAWKTSIFQGERILVNKWSYGLRIPFMSIFSYHRWRERPVRNKILLCLTILPASGKPVIDRREIYIGRCIGVPGDTLFIDSLFSVISPRGTIQSGQEAALCLSGRQRESDNFTHAHSFH